MKIEILEQVAIKYVVMFENAKQISKNRWFHK